MNIPEAKAVLAATLLISIVIVLPVANLVSTMGASSGSGEGVESSVEEVQTRVCPHCNCSMKHSIETSPYLWVCHCGYFVLR